MLVTMAIGFLAGGLVNGAIGVVLAAIAGVAYKMFFQGYRIPFGPWQALVNAIMPMLARFLFLIGLLLPFADGMTLPSGEYPDTLMKYVSIAIVKPLNLIGTVNGDYYPGIPAVTLLSIVLMVIGCFRLQKMRYLLIPAAGLVLFMLSPTISYDLLNSRSSILLHAEFFLVGFYVAWIGLALTPISNYILPRLLRTESPFPPAKTGALQYQQSYKFETWIAVLAAPMFVLQLLNLGPLSVHALQIGGLDFETEHHAVASIFSAIVAGGGAWNYQLNRYEMGSYCQTHPGQPGVSIESVGCTQLVPDRSFPH